MILLLNLIILIDFSSLQESEAKFKTVPGSVAKFSKKSILV